VTIRLDHLLISVLVLVLVVFALVFGASRVLHHDGSKSFTVKMSLPGGEVYVVVSAPAAAETVLENGLTASASGFATINLTDEKPEGPRDCTQSETIGQDGPEPPELQPYIGDTVTFTVYGNGLFADGLCEQLQQEGL
jgi:hypothetical protein